MRNAEATRGRILEAALAEFSAHGIAGARVDRIARTAGCNKNLIYIYYGNKESLLTTILRKHLARVYEDLPFTPEDLPGYAVRAFDFAAAHPDLMRLLGWWGLERRAEEAIPHHSARGAKIAELMKGQNAGRVGNVFPAEFLLTAILTLATAWTLANPFGSSIDSQTLGRAADLRRCIAEAVRLLSMT
jgi:AcrR family transcriptional regulator